MEDSQIKNAKRGTVVSWTSMGLEPGKAYVCISALLTRKPWTKLMFLSFMFFITKMMGFFSGYFWGSWNYIQ